jgi:hypothetical protein
MIFNSDKSGEKIPAKIYPEGFYEEILICNNYETRNPTVYGNVIRGKMEYPKSSTKRRID